VTRLSEKVDIVCERLGNPTFRQVVDGPHSDLVFETVEDLFRSST